MCFRGPSQGPSGIKARLIAVPPPPECRPLKEKKEEGGGGVEDRTTEMQIDKQTVQAEADVADSDRQMDG